MWLRRSGSGWVGGGEGDGEGMRWSGRREKGFRLDREGTVEAIDGLEGCCAMIGEMICMGEVMCDVGAWWGFGCKRR